MSADTTKPADQEREEITELIREHGWEDRVVMVVDHEEARPFHYRAAADSLRAIAEHRLEHSTDALATARAEGIKEAAICLERGLEDEGDTDA